MPFVLLRESEDAYDKRKKPPLILGFEIADVETVDGYDRNPSSTPAVDLMVKIDTIQAVADKLGFGNRPVRLWTLAYSSV